MQVSRHGLFRNSCLPSGVHRPEGGLGAFDHLKIVVAGDLMLDEYVWGEVNRISPEAPVPVIEVRSRSHRPGGAANVAANIAGLGGTAILGGVAGADRNGEVLLKTARAMGIRDTGVVLDSRRPTTTKTRVVVQNQQVARLDEEERSPLDESACLRLAAWFEEELATADACVLSDYAKGTVTKALARRLIGAARKAGKPVVVDPKSTDFSRYAGATVVTPNAREAKAAAAGCEELEGVAAALLKRLRGSALLVTQGADGMTLFQERRRAVHLRAEARSVFDVTGAGDTVVATLAVALAAGWELEEAARLANQAAGIAVGRIGTSTVSAEELSTASGAVREAGSRRAAD